MHPRPRRRLLSLAVFAPLAFAGTAAAADIPVDTAEEASPLVITGVEPTQSCGGEWNVSMGPAGDGTLIALLGTDEDYEISLPPDGFTVSRLSNCTLNIKTAVHGRISYALTKVSYEGHATLDADVIAEQSVSYGFTGGATSARVVQRSVGPLDDGVSLDEPFPTEGLVWSSCDEQAPPRDLQVRTSLYLRNSEPAGNGSLSMSLSPGVVMLVLEFATRPCPAPTT